MSVRRFGKGAKLRNAAMHGDLQEVTRLIQAGVNVDSADSNGWTALHSAANNNHPDVIDALATAQADLEARSTHGQSPLNVALQACHLQATRALLRSGADPNGRDPSGVTPFQQVTKMRQVFSEPMRLSGKVQTDTEALRDCQILIKMLREHGAKG